MPEGVRTSDTAPDDASALLRAWTDGDQRALARLIPIVYRELHRLAHHYLKRERAGRSLQTTALVNEAYMRLVDYKRMQWQNRAHFLAVSAQAMRRILVDRARRRNVKRGANAEHVSLDAEAIVDSKRSDDFVSLDDALTAAGAAGAAQSQGGRAALLRRPECRRDRRSAARVADHRDARVEERESVAVSRAGRRGRQWTTNAGTTSIGCCSPRSIGRWPSATSFYDAPAAATSSWNATSVRCSPHTTAPTAFSPLQRSTSPHASWRESAASAAVTPRATP